MPLRRISKKQGREGARKGLSRDSPSVQQGGKGQRNRNDRTAGKTFLECDSLSFGKKPSVRGWEMRAPAGAWKPAWINPHASRAHGSVCVRKASAWGSATSTVILKRQSPVAAGLRGDGGRMDVGRTWLSPQKERAKVLWLKEGACHSFVLSSQEGHPRGGDAGSPARPQESSWSEGKGKRLQAPKWH